MNDEAHDGGPTAKSPERIWLGPECQTEERYWCEDNVGCCDECGLPTIEYIRADVAAALARKPVVTDEMRRAGAQVLAEQAPFYFADATAKMETKPNSSALHIAGLVLNAALARDNITVGSTDDAN